MNASLVLRIIPSFQRRRRIFSPSFLRRRTICECIAFTVSFFVASLYIYCYFLQISIFDLPPSPRTPLGSQYSSAEKKSEVFSPNVSPLHDRTGSGPRVRSSSPRQRRVRFDNSFESASLNDASSPSVRYDMISLHLKYM